MAGGGKLTQTVGLALIAAGALGLAVVSWGMRAPDLRPEADCAALGPRLPQDTTTVAVTAPNQVLRVKRQACIWWRPGKYFVDEFAAQAKLRLAREIALKDEEAARNAFDAALKAYGPDVAAKREVLEARVAAREKIDADIAALSKPQQVALYLNGEESPVTFWSRVQADNRWQVINEKLQVPSDASGTVAENWRRLLGVDSSGSQSVTLGLGEVGGHVPRVTVGPGPIRLEVYTQAGLFAGVASLLALVAGVVLAGWNTAMLRDRRPADGDPDPPFSLGRSQLALWFMLTLGGFLFVWLVSGQFTGVLTAGVVGMLAVSGGMSLGGIAVDAAHESATEARLATARTAARMAGEPEPAAPPPRQSNGFFRDIISDGEGDVALGRVQAAAWTVLLAMFFVLHVWQTYSFPDFDKFLLALATLTSGLYVALKIPEKP